MNENDNAGPTNQSVREEYSQTIRRSVEEKYMDKDQENPVRRKQFDPMRNEQTMEVLCEEKQLRFCPWMNKQQEGCKNWKCMSLQHSRGEKNICMRG